MSDPGDQDTEPPDARRGEAAGENIPAGQERQRRCLLRYNS